MLLRYLDNGTEISSKSALKDGISGRPHKQPVLLPLRQGANGAKHLGYL